MKNRLGILIAAAVVLLAANVLNWAGVFAMKKKSDGAFKTVSSLMINWQKPGKPGDDKAVRNIFYSADAGNFGSEGSNEYARRQAAPKAKETPMPAPVKAWPLFRVSGVAVNGGKKCAFFSGPAFSGAVYEGNAINENYSVTRISGNKVEITDTITNEIKTYNMEAK